MSVAFGCWGIALAALSYLVEDSPVRPHGAGARLEVTRVALLSHERAQVGHCTTEDGAVYGRLRPGQPTPPVDPCGGGRSVGGSGERHTFAAQADLGATVIIPCRNEANHIERCLESVLAWDDIPGGFEVIVADGMSDDGTREILGRVVAQDRRVRVIDNVDRTTSHGLNSAVAIARGRLIARVDAHTEYSSDYLRRCVEAQCATGAWNVGGAARTRPSGYVSRAIAAAYACPFAVGTGSFHQERYEGATDTVPYGCWPRSTFEAVGLFDTQLTRNQDDEHNLRIRSAGGEVWQSASIRSWYTTRSSLGKLWRQYYQYGMYKVLVFRKHGRHASWRHFVPGAFVLSLPIAALPSVFHPLHHAAQIGLVAYAGAMGVACVATARRAGWDLLPLLPVVFATYHLSYGTGYLAGIVRFILCRRSVRDPGLSR